MQKVENASSLNDSERRSGNPILIVDPRTMEITNVNKAMLAEGIPEGFIDPNNIIGKPFTKFLAEPIPNLHDLLRQSLYIDRKLEAQAAGFWQQNPVWITLPIAHPTLGRRFVELKPQRVKDDKTGESFFHVELIDRTAQYFDSLTGAANRKYFTHLAQRELQRSVLDHAPIAFVFFDIDHFKQVNDSFGHEAGDLILQTVADRTQNTLSSLDVLGRYGGEEFAIVLPEHSTADAFTAAENIRRNVSANQINLDANTPLDAPTISMGIVSMETSWFFSAEIAIKYADLAMYAAKKFGRNRIAACHASEDGSAVMLIIAQSPSGYEGTWIWTDRPDNLEFRQLFDDRVKFNSLNETAVYFNQYKNTIHP